jgi:hypothetical protein
MIQGEERRGEERGKLFGGRGELETRNAYRCSSLQPALTLAWQPRGVCGALRHFVHIELKLIVVQTSKPIKDTTA